MTIEEKREKVNQALLLYGVTDRAWVGDKTFEEQIEDSLKGGVSCIQLREKSLKEDEFLEEAKVIRKLTKEYQIPLIINDNVEIALASDADGVQRGSTWQCCPGLLVYRRDIAKDVFGTDDPEEVGKKMKDWDTAKATAEELKA